MASISWSISKHEQLHLFFPDARTFHNIYKLQKHVLLRHQSYLIVFMGNKNLRFWQKCPFKCCLFSGETTGLLLFFLIKISYLECMFNSKAPGMFYYYFRPYWHVPKKILYHLTNTTSNSCCAKNRTTFTHWDPRVFQP
jgi:hypothetical protein